MFRTSMYAIVSALLLVGFSQAVPVVYKGTPGIAKNKHLVLLASDHEYRSEETIPALARILAKHHGFDCTVIFGLNSDGEITAGESNIPGTEALKTADGLVVFARFLAPPPEQMKHIDDYLNRAGPVVGLRTSTHGFKYGDKSDPYAKYDWQHKDDDYTGGFGHQVLGQSWVGHYGQNHRQSTRISIIDGKGGHPVLRGVKDIHVKCGGYNAVPGDDWEILTMAQPLMSMDFDGKPDASKPPKASEWMRTYKGKDGATGRAFTSLYGASEDIVNDGYRRMLINAVYWSMGLEDQIKADSEIAFVGPYKPNTFSNAGHAKGIKPVAYNGFESQIPANNNTAKEAAPKKTNEAAAVPKAKGKNTDGIKGPARYLRVSLEGQGRVLTLAEVEVFAGKKNIARSGKASQSSTSSGGDASRAIDGNTDGDYNKGGQTHSSPSTNPWFELDLGKEQAIDRVTLWNRDGFQDRLDQFTLMLLNEKRELVFSRTGYPGPKDVVSFETKKGADAVFFDRKGKKSKAPVAKKPAEPAITVAKVSVPADYRDPAPFAFAKDDIIAILGNGLADRMQHDGWMETLIQSQHPDLNLSFRNMSFSGDQIDKYPRNKGFTPMDEYLTLVKPDVLFFFFGYNESFAGPSGADSYRDRLVKQINHYRSIQPNGETLPRIVLFSPIAFENLNDPNFPNGRSHNLALAAFTIATQQAAERTGVAFVDLFNPSQALYNEVDAPLTLNGVHLNEQGNRKVGEVIASVLLNRDVLSSSDHEALRQAVLDKNWHWHNRFRATDGNDVWGGRSTLKFVDDQSNAEVLQHELKMFDVMTANRDVAVWAVANGKAATVDDSNVPAPIPVISNVGGGSRSSNASKEGSLKYLSAEESIERMTIPDAYQVNVFADEKMFPELANPVQMQVDNKGRIWAAAWGTYPKWEPLKEMNDYLLIFEDTDGDGKADKSIRFATVHNPLGFEFWNNGVLVTSGTDLLYLRDTDGDDIADVRYVILQGLGSSDTHHAANNLIFGPSGGIYWQAGIFLQHAHETPWSTALVAGNSGMYRFDPRRHTIAFHAGNSPNPHGTSFDYWGYCYANDGTGGRSYQVRPEGNGFKMHTLLDKEVRPVAADEIISSDHFPEDVQGNFLVCNTIGFLGLKHYKLHKDGFEEKGMKRGEVWGTPEEPMLFNSDKNFRPTDAVFGADGALYIADWQNVIIGHMQHNIRDPNRDHIHGRIFRMTHKTRPLQKPVAIAGEPISALLENLKHRVNGIRHRTRVELSGRNSGEVIAAATEWAKQFDATKAEDAHHLLEVLWLHQQFNVRNEALLASLLDSPEEHCRIAAATVKHHWGVADPARGAQVIAAVKEIEIKKSGILSDTADLTEIRINTVIEKMKYDQATLPLKAGKKVKLYFANPDFMPHNLVLVKPGAADEIGMAAIALGADGFAMQFVPKSDKILASTKLVDHAKEVVLEFTAPTEPGDYPYICTFPGHHLLMRGVFKVR